MIKNTNAKDLCSQLEQWGLDDLNLLSEFGAAGFSTPQLFHMRVELTDKIVMSDRRYNFLFLALFCSFGWAVFGTGLLVIGMDFLAYPVFGLFALSTGIAVVGMLLLNKSNSGTKHLMHYLELIQMELESRKYARVELQP
jgi:hypothetical protein